MKLFTLFCCLLLLGCHTSYEQRLSPTRVPMLVVTNYRRSFMTNHATLNTYALPPVPYIPPHTKYMIDAWIDEGQYPGSFLAAVLSNDLMEAFARADEMNTAYMRGIVFYLYNYAPRFCYGDAQAVERWSTMHGEHPENAEKFAAMNRDKRRNYGKKLPVLLVTENTDERKKKATTEP